MKKRAAEVLFTRAGIACITHTLIKPLDHPINSMIMPLWDDKMQSHF